MAPRALPALRHHVLARWGGRPFPGRPGGQGLCGGKPLFEPLAAWVIPGPDQATDTVNSTLFQAWSLGMWPTVGHVPPTLSTFPCGPWWLWSRAVPGPGGP